MHARKARMAELVDAFIAMPGGYGTFEELFEIITWAQLGLHQKPIGLLNVAGYFDALILMIEHAITEGFIRAAHRQLIVVATQPALLEALAQHTLPPVRPAATQRGLIVPFRLCQWSQRGVVSRPLPPAWSSRRCA